MPLRRGEICRLQLPLRRPSLRAMRKFRSLAALVAIATLIPLSSAGAMPPPLADVEGKDAASLAAAMTAGETSSEEIVAAYLQRIAEIDDAGPTLNAVIATFPDAMAVARERDAERKAGRLRGPLHRSEEHTSELQSLMRTTYAVFCLKK